LQFGVLDDNLLDLDAQPVNVYERPLHGIAADRCVFGVVFAGFFFEPAR
jgi:hypothetical protein